MDVTPIVRCLALLATASVPVTAQTTHIVDARGGGQFTLISAAVAVAVDGDTVLVRPGTYTDGWATGKALAVVGEPGAIVRRGSVPVAISGVAAGKTTTLRGFAFTNAFTDTLVIENCAGRVHLEDLDVVAAAGIGVVRVTNSAQVSMTGVDVAGFDPVHCDGSSIAFVECAFTAEGFLVGGTALTVTSSNVTLVGGTLAGGAGFTAGSGIVMTGGQLTLAGRNTAVLVGASSAVPVSGVAASSGSIARDPAVTITSANGAPPISGGATVTTRRVASVTTRRNAARLVQVEIHAAASSAFCLFAGLPRAIAMTPFGDLWFDVAGHVVLGCGTIGASETFTRQVNLGALPPGFALVLQAAVAQGAMLELSTPAVVVVE